MPAPEPPREPPVSVPPPEIVRGLERSEEQLPVGRYFSLFSWDHAPADPEMASGAFLDAL